MEGRLFDLEGLSIEQLLNILQVTSTKTLIVAQEVASKKLIEYAEKEGSDYPIDDIANLDSLIIRYTETQATIKRIRYAIRGNSQESVQTED